MFGVLLRERRGLTMRGANLEASMRCSSAVLGRVAPGVLAVVAVTAALASGCADATKTATECAQSDLIARCPAGSNPVLGAEAQAACGGSFNLEPVEGSGGVTGQCQSAGSCKVMCQYVSPCSCGVATLSTLRRGDGSGASDHMAIHMAMVRSAATVRPSSGAV